MKWSAESVALVAVPVTLPPALPDAVVTYTVKDDAPITSSLDPRAKAQRQAKRMEHKRHMKEEALAALPATVPTRMLEKLRTRPTDHHPRCPCLRCKTPTPPNRLD